jgi:hypothetical protein
VVLIILLSWTTLLNRRHSCTQLWVVTPCDWRAAGLRQHELNSSRSGASRRASRAEELTEECDPKLRSKQPRQSLFAIREHRNVAVVAGQLLIHPSEPERRRIRRMYRDAAVQMRISGILGCYPSTLPCQSEIENLRSTVARHHEVVGRQIRCDDPGGVAGSHPSAICAASSIALRVVSGRPRTLCPSTNSVPM